MANWRMCAPSNRQWKQAQLPDCSRQSRNSDSYVLLICCRMDRTHPFPSCGPQTTNDVTLAVQVLPLPCAHTRLSLPPPPPSPSATDPLSVSRTHGSMKFPSEPQGEGCRTQDVSPSSSLAGRSAGLVSGSPPSCCVNSLLVPQGGSVGPGDPTVNKPASCHPKPLLSCQIRGLPHPPGFGSRHGNPAPPQLLGPLQPRHLTRTAPERPVPLAMKALPFPDALAQPKPWAWKVRG